MDDEQGDPLAAYHVILDEAFYHPRFGVVLWHHYVEHDDLPSFVMSAKLNDETRAQSFVDAYVERLELDDKPTFSLN